MDSGSRFGSHFYRDYLSYHPGFNGMLSPSSSCIIQDRCLERPSLGCGAASRHPCPRPAMTADTVQSRKGASDDSSLAHRTAPHASSTRRTASHAPVRSAARCHSVHVDASAFGPEVSPAWLHNQFRSNGDADISIVDVRAYESYWAAHIPVRRW